MAGNATFAAAGQKLKFEIRIGHSNVGTCEYFLFDKNNRQLQYGIGQKGVNRFVIDSPPDTLDGALLMWNAVINASNNQPGQDWAVTLTIKQGSQQLIGGVIVDQGKFQTVTIMSNEVRLKAA